MDITRQDTYLLWPVYGREGVRTHMKVPLWFEDVYLKYRFNLHSGGYAVSRINNKLTYAHRLIVDTALEVDHINGDRLDNRVENLRPATRQQNSFNTKAHSDSTSEFKGVHWVASRSCWHAVITVNGKRLFLGSYDDEASAKDAYLYAAAEIMGDFGRTP